MTHQLPRLDPSTAVAGSPVARVAAQLSDTDLPVLDVKWSALLRVLSQEVAAAPGARVQDSPLSSAQQLTDTVSDWLRLSGVATVDVLRVITTAQQIELMPEGIRRPDETQIWVLATPASRELLVQLERLADQATRLHYRPGSDELEALPFTPGYPAGLCPLSVW